MSSNPISNPPQNQIEEIGRAFVKLCASVGSLVVEWAWSELILQAGWLPHPSIPPELVANARDVGDADARLALFFRSNCSQVERSLRGSIAATSVDSKAKGAFYESLEAHRLGLYRVAPALLFPHLERVGRDVVLPSALGASPASRLVEAVGQLGASEFTMPGVSGLRLYSKLAEHLHRQVRTSDEVDAARLDPVPNRHAVLHGRVDYVSEKSSLNMLIMTHFILDALSKIRLERLGADVG